MNEKWWLSLKAGDSAYIRNSTAALNKIEVLRITKKYIVFKNDIKMKISNGAYVSRDTYHQVSFVEITPESTTEYNRKVMTNYIFKHKEMFEKITIDELFFVYKIIKQQVED